MWPDNETTTDFLNFSGVARTVAEIIVQAEGRPISIGISGAWGVGKSSMIKLVRKELEQLPADDQPEFVFVEFNAWLYQGYDDARAALMEVIAKKLHDEAEGRKTGLEHVGDFMKRVNWLRLTKLAVGTALPLVMGLPPVGAIGEITALVKKVVGGTASADDVSNLGQKTANLEQAPGDFLKAKVDTSPPQEIDAMRQSFEAALAAMKIRLVVLIDDLDRCLPETTISTLEAIRLFLFLRDTAFVIAADDAMIKHAVKRHFEGVDDALVINYFDKLVQIPIRVPPLGLQEVRAYLLLLFMENSHLDKDVKETVRGKVCDQLASSWRGTRVDSAFLRTLLTDIPPELASRLEMADRLAPLLTQTSQILGNPRLIKRFLNALSVRMAVARTHGVGVDEKAVTKMLLFERCGSPSAYSALIKAVVEDPEGKPRVLKDWEEKALAGKELTLKDPWNDPFFHDWLTVPPQLSDTDLRGILYISREHAMLFAAEDRLSRRGTELLNAILLAPEVANTLKDDLAKLQKLELTLIMEQLLEKAHQEQSWGAPPILNACITVVEADSGQTTRLSAFLQNLPPAQINAAIVPRISDYPWSAEVFKAWEVGGISGTVKKAILERKPRGNI